MREALALFCQKGYDAVTVAQIADAVGIKAPSLYNHFKSKQGIFDAILHEMHLRYQHHVKSSMNISGVNPDEDADFFTQISAEDLIEMGTHLFRYFLHDEYASQFRKMLTIEQYRNGDLANRYLQQNIEDPLSFQSALFNLFIQKGSMIPEDPRVMALHFYAPIFVLLILCDNQPGKEPDALEMLKSHIAQFNRLYRK